MDQGERRFDKGDLILGKLEVIRVLGEGGMGIVYEVEHRITKHRRAIKLLHPHISKDSAVTARLLREASVAGRLRTKHVVETFDAGQLPDGAAYVLMEMLEGKAYAEVLEEGRPSTGRVVSIIWEACEGLAVAHREGIVHRDLKPDNMFVSHDLDGEEVVKLLDFGISKFAEKHDYQGTLTADGAVMGTPFYMSPEQTRGLKEIDGRTDIYALGVILYESIAGKVPFDAETFPMLVVNIHTGNYEPLQEVVPDIDPGLAAVVHKAMATEVGERYSSVRDLQEALRPFADRELPERMGTDSALALERTMAGDSLPPRLSTTQTPMSADNTKALTEERPKPKGLMFAVAGLTLVGVAGLSAAALMGGEGGDDAGAATRGLGDVGGVGGVGGDDAAMAEAVDSGGGMPVGLDIDGPDAGSDGGADTDAGRDTGAASASAMARERPTMGRGMRPAMGAEGMSTTSMMGVVIDTEFPGG